jgi:hypothetical protein
MAATWSVKAFCVVVYYKWQDKHWQENLTNVFNLAFGRFNDSDAWCDGRTELLICLREKIVPGGGGKERRDHSSY